MSAVGGKSGLGALAAATTKIDPHLTNGPPTCDVGFHLGNGRLSAV